jgi:soluble cytochrome b562
MKQSLNTSIILTMMTASSLTAKTQQLDLAKMKGFEHQLDYVMEIIDTTILKSKLKEVELEHAKNANEINSVRLAIIYHETALSVLSGLST